MEKHFFLQVRFVLVVIPAVILALPALSTKETAIMAVTALGHYCVEATTATRVGRTQTLIPQMTAACCLQTNFDATVNVWFGMNMRRK